MPYADIKKKRAWREAKKKTEHGRRLMLLQKYAWRARYPERYRAHRAVEYAVKIGRLTRPSACPSCGAERKVHGHHADYSKPLEVVWLCDRCHRSEHERAFADPPPETGRGG